MARERVTATSTFYWTEPLGRPGQPRFLNGAWRVETERSARELKFDVLRPIESALGRERNADKYAPRTIDLDVVLYGDGMIEEPDLTVPDPDIRDRPFLAVPLLELAPELRLPDTGERLAELPVVGWANELLPACELSAKLRRMIER
jgi:2-amino-4-hydroxy-6-hydroxymethyldihydropteridine diphosphokinase